MLIPIETIRVLLWLADNDTSKDTLIELFYDKSIWYIENYIWTKFYDTELDIEEIEEYIDWLPQNTINLSSYPIITIEEIKEKIDNQFTLIDNTFYNVNKKSWQVNFDNILKSWFMNYKVLYKSWFYNLNLPKDLKNCIIELTVWYLLDNKKQNSNIKSQSIDDASITFLNDLDNLQTIISKTNIILDKYRIYDI